MDEKRQNRKGADKTRQNILKAAKALFVRQGFAATSMSQIAKKANINQSLIHHHFENKENLWRLVKADIIKNYLKEFNKIFNDPDLTGEEMIRKFLRMRIDIGTKKPEIQKMFMWQYIEGGNTALRHVPGYEITKWLALVESLQQKGELRQDLHPRVILVLVLAEANGLLNFINDLNDDTMRETCIHLAEQMLMDTLLGKKDFAKKAQAQVKKQSKGKSLTDLLKQERAEDLLHE